jgi:UDP-N-acetylglucosamine--N-acetylmuramyl-(pentapeptide) pyrophosphoryl-undecaprenol N-acetylglucosamine transferase
MKILLTGGESGGHFYPLIAVAQELREVAKDRKLISPNLFFYAPSPYNEKLLFDNKIYFKKVSTGKKRNYKSILNFFDFFKTAKGMVVGLWKVFWEYPDVIFSKGGYGSFPIVMAGRILGIPIVIHESDSTPGRVNKWASKFAARIAISYPEAAKHFPEGKTAWTGNPVRKEVEMVSKEGAKEYLKLEPDVPVLLILGGSQGAKIINEAILDALPRLVEKYQIIHQTGKDSFEEIKETAEVLIKDPQLKSRYRPFSYLDNLAMRMSAGASDLVITRAGSTLFEVALWGIPSIAIPITNSVGNHQRKNAYTYARSGASVVIEEKNLSDDILLAQLENILGNEDVYKEMAQSAKAFAKPEAARTIAEEIIDIAQSHNKPKKIKT